VGTLPTARYADIMPAKQKVARRCSKDVMWYDHVADAARSPPPWVLHTNGGRGLRAAQSQRLTCAAECWGLHPAAVVGRDACSTAACPAAAAVDPSGAYRRTDQVCECRADVPLLSDTDHDNENGGHKCPVPSTTSRRAEPTARSSQVGESLTYWRWRHAGLAVRAANLARVAALGAGRAGLLGACVRKEGRAS